MDLTTLFEDEESDRADRLSAVILHTQISQWLENNEQNLEYRLKHIRGGVLDGGLMLTMDMVDMDEYYRDLVVVFTSKPDAETRTDQNGGQFVTQGGLFIFKGLVVIGLPILKGPGDTTHLASRFRVGGKRSFIHEFMHYLMRRRSTKKGSVSVLSHGLDPDAYFNNDDETNAYYQEAAQDVVELTQSILDVSPRWVEKLANMSVQELVAWFKPRSFNKDFLKYASPKTMRALDKRLARLIVTTIKPMIEKAQKKGGE